MKKNRFRLSDDKKSRSDLNSDLVPGVPAALTLIIQQLAARFGPHGPDVTEPNLHRGSPGLSGPEQRSRGRY